MKTLDLNKTVYQLVKEFPELVDILSSLGFKEITKKAMLESMGRIMTIPKGSKVKNIPLSEIINRLTEEGFILENMPDDVDALEVKVVTPITKEDISRNRTEQIKSYLLRLSNGEDLETVKSEFVEEFKDVEASEIMKAEQEILSEGTPLKEVQRLCDVHSALFHGSTKEEKIANAELAVAASLQKENKPESETESLIQIEGHPLNTFTKENQNLEKLIEDIKDKINNHKDITEDLKKLQDVSIHYRKKGDLLYPHLKVKYNISGPHQVMWTVDNELRDDLNKLVKTDNKDSEYYSKLEDLLNRMQEMIYKETNILFPILTENFTEDEWKGVYFDSKDYRSILGVDETIWKEAENPNDFKAEVTDEVIIPGGHLKLEQLRGIMKLLPVEVTFIDENDINRYFNEGPKVFKRPLMALDREVFSCHPPKVEPIVRNIIDDFKNSRRDSVSIWMEKEGKPFLVQYIAVRDDDGKYIGTAEFVQDMAFAKEHFEKEAAKKAK